MRSNVFVVVLAAIVAQASALPAADKRQPQIPASEVAGDRFVLDGAQCNTVQGRLVCDDGLGNTFFADDAVRG
ncbi:hypothetical protein ACJ41O_012339 [Fusarium nematophilum]